VSDAEKKTIDALQAELDKAKLELRDATSRARFYRERLVECQGSLQTTSQKKAIQHFRTRKKAARKSIKRQQRKLDILKAIQNGCILLKEIHEKTKLPYSSLKRDLRDLQEEGRVFKIGRNYSIAGGRLHGTK